MAGALIQKVLGGTEDDPTAPDHLPTCFELLNAELPKERRDRVDHTADKPWFNLLVGFGIVLNTLLLGIDVDSQRSNKLEDRFGFFIIDVLFFVAFAVEMGFRIHQHQWEYFADPWNLFDFNVVILTCADLIVSITEGASGGLKVASAIRICRLLRIVRSIRGLNVFYGLWIVLQGLIESLRLMLWVSMLLMMIVYVIAVAITTFVGQSQFVQDNWDEAYVYVGSVSRSMWTVMQLITFDSWGESIARPLMRVSPAASIVLFVSIIVCAFGVLNVVIAVMVERSLSLAKESKDAQRTVLDKTEKQLFMSMGKDFREASGDGSGEVTREEFSALVQSDNMSFKLRLLGIHTAEADELFDILDDDGSGTVSDEEFVKGLQKLKGNAHGIGLVALISFAKRQRNMAEKYHKRIQKLNEKADEIQARLLEVGRWISIELRGRKVSDEHAQTVWKHAAEREMVLKGLDKKKQITYPGLASLPM